MFWQRLLPVRVQPSWYRYEIVQGDVLENTFKYLLVDSRIAYLHILNAK